MKRARILFLTLVIVVIALVGCGNASSEGVSGTSVKDNVVMDNSTVIPEGDYIMENEDANKTEDGSLKENEITRKIIFTYNYDMETKNLDESVKMIEDAISKAGGYCEESKVDGNTKNGGDASFVIRVPSDKVDTFLKGTENFGSIVSQSKNGQDVTSQYFDIESRLTTLKIRRERITELLKKASTLDDIIKLEQELSSINYDYERLTTNLKKYDNLIDYVTVKISIEQVSDYSDTDESFFDMIGETFKDSFALAVNVFKGAVIVVIWLLPYFLTGGIIAIVIILLCRIRNKKTKSKQ